MTRTKKRIRQENKMLTYKLDSWPDDKHPSELYLNIYRGEEKIDRIVVLNKGVYIDIDIKLKTERDLLQFVSIVESAWSFKEKQDRKGWRKRD